MPVDASSPGSGREDKAGAAARSAVAGLPPPPRRVSRRKPPARRTALTVEAIVQAAVEVLDEAGMAGLSMRRVADRLDTGAASLYAHVAGKDELLELVFDELIGQVPLPEPDPARWREQLYTMMFDLRDILASHRDAALAGLGRVPTSPKTLVAAEAVVEVMRAGGLSDRAVALGLDQLTLHVSAAAFELGLFEHSGMTPDEIERYFKDVDDFYDALPADRFPVLASISAEISGPDKDERFRFGIEMMIAGLEALSAAEKTVT
jgi:AcrR family transcriptional regulator